jgi:hypothetical protein
MNKLKVMGVASGVAAVLLSASVALAEEMSPGTMVKIQEGVRMMTATTTRSQVMEKMETKMDSLRDDAKERMGSERKEMKAHLETARVEMKDRMEKEREDAKAKMESAREEAKMKMETKREEAKQRLSDIRDSEKQKKAEHIAEQLEHLNLKWTEHFTEQINKYGGILLKMQERADLAATSGKDVSAVNSAILLANTAVASAQTAVTAQSAKTYVLDASTVVTTTVTATQKGQDELVSSLRTAFQKIHKALFADLTALRDGPMKNARASVQGALQALKQIPNIDEDGNDNASTDTVN